MKWIKCKDKLPKTPKTWREYFVRQRDYIVAYPNGVGGYSYQTMGWCDGWNCSMRPDGTICREHEIKDVEAWMEIPKYEG